MTLEEGLLKTVLEMLIKNALPMIAVYWFLKRPFVLRWFKKVKPFIENELGLTTSVIKRVTSILLSVVISTILFIIYAAVGFTEFPQGFIEWADVILAISAINFTGTQVLHTKDLLQK